MTATFVVMQIPSLNDVPLHYLKPNSLVKFRCLIQDMFDPEFFMGVYETVDPSTKAKVRASLSSHPCSDLHKHIPLVCLHVFLHLIVSS